MDENPGRCRQCSPDCQNPDPPRHRTGLRRVCCTKCPSRTCHASSALSPTRRPPRSGASIFLRRDFGGLRPPDPRSGSCVSFSQPRAAVSILHCLPPPGSRRVWEAPELAVLAHCDSEEVLLSGTTANRHFGHRQILGLVVDSTEDNQPTFALHGPWPPQESACRNFHTDVQNIAEALALVPGSAPAKAVFLSAPSSLSRRELIALAVGSRGKPFRTRPPVRSRRMSPGGASRRNCSAGASQGTGPRFLGRAGWPRIRRGIGHPAPASSGPRRRVGFGWKRLSPAPGHHEPISASSFPGSVP